MKLEFVRGNPQNPTGNLIAWCRVISENPVQKDADYMACNIVVSLLDAWDKSFPVVVFPPIAIENKQELRRIISMKKEYDVIRIADYNKPSSISDGKYIEERLEDLNQQVVEYVELCRECYEYFELDRTQNSLAVDILVDKLSDEERTLLQLEESLQRHQKPLFINELPNILKHIQKKYPQYDAHNMLRVVRKNDARLAQLYLKKYKAIFNEEYEQAAALHQQIQSQESLS